MVQQPPGDRIPGATRRFGLEPVKPKAALVQETGNKSARGSPDIDPHGELMTMGVAVRFMRTSRLGDPIVKVRAARGHLPPAVQITAAVMSSYRLGAATIVKSVYMYCNPSGS